MQCRPAPSPSTDSTSLPRPPYTSLTRSVSGRSGLRCSHWAGLAGLAGLAMLARPLLLLLLLLPPAGRPRPSAAGGLSRPEAKRRRAGGRSEAFRTSLRGRVGRRRRHPHPTSGRRGRPGPPALTAARYGRFSSPLPFPSPPRRQRTVGQESGNPASPRSARRRAPAPPPPTALSRPNGGASEGDDDEPPSPPLTLPLPSGPCGALAPPPPRPPRVSRPAACQRPRPRGTGRSSHRRLRGALLSERREKGDFVCRRDWCLRGVG